MKLKQGQSKQRLHSLFSHMEKEKNDIIFKYVFEALETHDWKDKKIGEVIAAYGTNITLQWIPGDTNIR